MYNRRRAYHVNYNRNDRDPHVRIYPMVNILIYFTKDSDLVFPLPCQMKDCEKIFKIYKGI